MFLCSLVVKYCRLICTHPTRWAVAVITLIAVPLMIILLHQSQQVVPPPPPVAPSPLPTVLILPRAQYPHFEESRPEVTLALVVCGQKRNVASNALNLIKSAIIFSKDVVLHIIIFRDEGSNPSQIVDFERKVAELVEVGGSLGRQITVLLKPTAYPQGEDEDWRNMYMPCCTQRLFFSTLLPTTDAVIYLDADTLFLTNLKEVWDQFGKMTPDQVGGMISEVEPPGYGWYNMVANHPYAGLRGMNSGVLFMNLTRMRQIQFEQKIQYLYKKHKHEIIFIDQDLLNILFHNRPELMYPMNCGYNFRHGHCACYYPDTGRCDCEEAEQKGISIIHGNLDGFKQLPLQIIQQHFDMYPLSMDSPKSLLEAIENELQRMTMALGVNAMGNRCINSTLHSNFLSKFRKYAQNYKNT